MDHPRGGGDFQRNAAGQYAAAYVASLDASRQTVKSARWALRWIVAGAPTIVLDGGVIIRWLHEQDLAARSRQVIWDRTRSWYRWMAETYPGADLPVLGPHNFGRRNYGETRGRKPSGIKGHQKGDA